MRGLGLVTIMTAAGVVLLGAVPAAASGWTVVPAPPPDGGFFNAVSTRTDTRRAVRGRRRSANDVWIVGQYFDTTASALEPFTAHWNGTAWATVPVPASGAELEGLAVIGHTDAWVVGMGPKGKAVTENWTGKRIRAGHVGPRSACSVTLPGGARYRLHPRPGGAPAPPHGAGGDG